MRARRRRPLTFCTASNLQKKVMLLANGVWPRVSLAQTTTALEHCAQQETNTTRRRNVRVCSSLKKSTLMWNNFFGGCEAWKWRRFGLSFVKEIQSNSIQFAADQIGLCVYCTCGAAAQNQFELSKNCVTCAPLMIAYFEFGAHLKEFRSLGI
jgi:hypothetical protein